MLSYFVEAARVLLANRTRSILTILGLIVGVGSIVSIQVAAKGMAGAVNGVFQGMNANMFYIYPKATQGNGVRAALHQSDIMLVRSRVAGTETVIPIGISRTMVDAGHQRAVLLFAGESDKRFSTAPLVAGRTLTPDDMTNATAVCLISNNAYTRLFPKAASPAAVLGRSIYKGSHRYVVVGVLGSAKLETASLGFDISNDVSIPYTTYYNDYQRGQALFGIHVLGGAGASLKSLETQTQMVLTQAHPGAQYQIFDLNYYAKTINGFFAVVGLIVSAVGAISLVVAGIGIMNIMLVSVTERTREIGVRKAIGARRTQILAQFFIESLLLSASGCLIGMALGLSLGVLADKAFIARISGVTGSIPWLEAVFIAVGFATIVTLVFGTYPAYRAARLDPIQALRYE